MLVIREKEEKKNAFKKNIIWIEMFGSDDALQLQKLKQD